MLYIIVAIIAPSFWSMWIFRKLIVVKSCALIGQLSGALWLAEYLKRVTEMLRPWPYLEHTASPQQQHHSKNKKVNIWAVLC